MKIYKQSCTTIKVPSSVPLIPLNSDQMSVHSLQLHPEIKIS